LRTEALLPNGGRASVRNQNTQKALKQANGGTGVSGSN